MVDLPRFPSADSVGSSFGAIPFDLATARAAAVDGPILTAVWTMPSWYPQLHGLAAEVAFWACVVLAVGRAAWFLVQVALRLWAALKAAASPKDGH